MTLIRTALLVCAIFLVPWQGFGQDATAKPQPDTDKKPLLQQVNRTVHAQTVAAGVEYLLNRGQDKQDGSFSKQLGPAVSAICTTALIKSGLPLEQKNVAAGLKYVEGFIKPDGGIYAPESTLRNYEPALH